MYDPFAFCHLQINILGPTSPFEISWYGITKISRMRYVGIVSSTQIVVGLSHKRIPEYFLLQLHTLYSLWSDVWKEIIFWFVS